MADLPEKIRSHDTSLRQFSIRVGDKSSGYLEAVVDDVTGDRRLIQVEGDWDRLRRWY